MGRAGADEPGAARPLSRPLPSIWSPPGWLGAYDCGRQCLDCTADRTAARRTRLAVGVGRACERQGRGFGRAMSCLELAKADSEASLIQGSPARRQLLYFRRRRLAEGPKT